MESEARVGSKEDMPEHVERDRGAQKREEDIALRCYIKTKTRV
jgi:hypothetical protein